MKVILDKFHGNIEVTYLESHLLKHPVVNRLHHVLQNSMVYQVFPCCKTSRFEHSLGVMHLAGNMFISGMSNSICGKDFLDAQLNHIYESIPDKGNFSEILLLNDLDSDKESLKKKNRFETKYKGTSSKESVRNFFQHPDVLKTLKSIIGTDYLQRNIFITNLQESEDDEKTNERLVMYLMLLQVVRIYGFLHDIGHLPFSHLYEFSLFNTSDFVSKKFSLLNGSKSNSSTTEAASSPIEESSLVEKELYSEMSHVISEITEREKSRNTKKSQPHEIIGFKLMAYIIKEIKNNKLKDSDADSDIELLALFYFFNEIMQELSNGDQGNMKPIYRIVAGMLDADRLDYVQRDGEMSGILKFSGNIDRIVKQFVLVKIKDKDRKKEKEEDHHNEQFLFCPSIQSLNDVEDVLRDRYLIYKNLVNHHAVKRADTILQKAIENSIKFDIEDIVKSKPNIGSITNPPVSPENLFDSVKYIYYVLDDQNNKGFNAYYYFTQLTDFWLLSYLTKEYSELIFGSGAKDEVLFQLLEELFESKRKYKSLWKRFHQYEDWLNKFIEAFKPQLEFMLKEVSSYISTEKLLNLEDNEKDQSDFIQKLIEKEFLKPKAFIELCVMIKKYDAYLTLSNEMKINLCNALVTFLNEYVPNWNRLIEDEFLSLGKNIILAPTNIGTGISRNTPDEKHLCFVDINDKLDDKHHPVYDLEEISTIHELINVDNRRTIKFYFYFHSGSYTKKDKEEIKDKLNQSIIKIFNHSFYKN